MEIPKLGFLSVYSGFVGRKMGKIDTRHSEQGSIETGDVPQDANKRNGGFRLSKE